MPDEKKIIQLSLDESDALALGTAASVGLLFFESMRPLAPQILILSSRAAEGLQCLVAQAAGVPCPRHHESVAFQEPTEENQRISVEGIKDTAERVEHLVKDLIEFSSSFRDRQVASFQP